MRTSVIRYRVADFLRENPPFQLLPEQVLLDLAHAGRVSFHQEEEILFQAGQKRRPLVWVVQQGVVELKEGTGGDGALVDIVGPGQVLGFDGLSPSAVYTYSAWTTSEVILYGFDRAAFEAAIQGSAGAIRFLTTARTPSSSELPAETGAEVKGQTWLHMGLPVELGRDRLVTATPDISLRQAATLLAQRRSEAILLLGPDALVAGCCTATRLSTALGEGAALDAPVREFMTESIPVLADSLSLGEYLLAMARSGARVLAVNPEGSPNVPPTGLITRADLLLFSAGDPLRMLDELEVAETPERIGLLRQRADAFLLANFTNPSLADWFCDFYLCMARATAKALARIALHALPGCGHYSVVLLDTAARAELPGAVEPVLGIIYQDPAEGSQMRALAESLSDLYRRAGYGPPRDRLAGDQRLCQPAGEWDAFLARLVRDPIFTGIFLYRGVLDMVPASGEQSLIDQLRATLAAELVDGDSAIAIMANDSMVSLPPLTFYQEQVVELRGGRAKRLDLYNNALRPISDAARVLALAKAPECPPGTLARLHCVAERLPAAEGLLRDAADAFRLVLYHVARRAAAREPEAGWVDPPTLTRWDQQMLKGAFRSIHRLLEFTFQNYDGLRAL